MLSPTPLRTYQAVQEAVAHKFVDKPQFSYSTLVHDTLTPPELVCWLIDELYLSLWGDFSRWFDCFVNIELSQRDIRPTLLAMFALVEKEYPFCVEAFGYLLARKTFSVDRVDIFKQLYSVHEADFIALREILVTRWPDDVDPILLPAVSEVAHTSVLKPAVTKPMFPSIEISLLLFIGSEGRLQKGALVAQVVEKLWSARISDRDLVDIYNTLRLASTDIDFLSQLEQTLTVLPDSAYDAYQTFLLSLALPIWWKQVGIMCIKADLSQEVKNYLDSIGVRYVDYSQAAAEREPISDLLRKALRQDPDYILLDANMVTSADIVFIKEIVGMGVGRPIFFGENELLAGL